jgi:hypothetical protein
VRRSAYCTNRLQTEDEHQRLVNGAQFASVQPSSRPAEAFWIDDDLLSAAAEASSSRT